VIANEGVAEGDASVFSYSEKGHAFMSEEPVMIAKATEMGFKGAGDVGLQTRVWNGIFEFYRKHLN
jgi:hypothetical protein